MLLLPPPPPPRFPAAAWKRDLLGLVLLLSPLALPLLFLLPSPTGPSVFLRRAEAAASLPLPPPAPLPPTLPLLRRAAAAPLLSAAWNEERRTLSPSGGPASTQDDDGDEDEEEEEGVAVVASLPSVVVVASSPPAAEAFSLPPGFLPPGCLCCGVARHAVPDLGRVTSFAHRDGARERAAGRRGAVGIGEPATAVATTGGAALLLKKVEKERICKWRFFFGT